VKGTLPPVNQNSSRLRSDLSRMLTAALRACDAGEAVRRALRLDGKTLRIADREEVPLARVRRVLVVGAGKAACAMTRGAADVLGERIAGGSVTTRHRHGLPLPGITVWEAGHPAPDACGLAGAADALRTARLAGADDLLLCLLSGGGSALWAAPAPGLALGDLQDATSALLRAGAPIGEINSVRKHLGRIGGGWLARSAAPARLVTLAVSDVVGDRLDVIASGPTVPDPSTYAEALEVVHRRCGAALPRVTAHLAAGAAGALPETPKRGDDSFRRSSAYVVARNRDAIDALAREAAALGYTPEIVDAEMKGEASRVGRRVAERSLRARAEGRRVALLWGGETTVTVRGGGRGGRNQELALAAALALQGEADVVVAALGTDGSDGPTEAAGAMVDGGSADRARAAGLDAADYLRRNDAHPLLRAAGDLLVTGPTGTHVNDVVVALAEGGIV
jgi:glycerate-2-kinase